VFSLPIKSSGYYTIVTGLFDVLKNKRFDIVNIHGYGANTWDIMCLLKKLRLLNISSVLTAYGIAGLKLGYLARNFTVSLKQRTGRICILVFVGWYIISFMTRSKRIFTTRFV
jgi:hypothetical protein